MELRLLWRKYVARLRGADESTVTADGTGEGAKPAEPKWSLKVRPPMDSSNKNRKLCEWVVTRMHEAETRECRIDGIWFLATIGRTLEARETVERLSTPLPLGVKELRDIIEAHRARGRRVHVARSIGNVRIENTFASANDKDFAEVLEWGRPT